MSSLPTTLAGLTSTQKALAITKMQALIALIPTLPAGCITPDQAQQIITLANDAIAVNASLSFEV